METINQKYFILSLSLLLILGIVESFDYHEKELETDEGLLRMYDRWRGHHQVEQRSPERFNVFKYNLRHVHDTNKMNKPYKLKLNMFANMTNLEFTNTYGNSKIGHYQALRGPPDCNKSSTYGGVTNLPLRVDWRKQNAVTPVKAQGTCVAAVEGINAIRTGQLIQLSEQQLIDCDSNGSNRGCQGGAMEPAFKFIQEHGGLATEESYPYLAKRDKCDQSKFGHHSVTLDGMEELDGTAEALLKAVAHQPVAGAVDSSGHDFQFYKSGVFTGQCGTDLKHAITVVGYDETLEGLKYWIMKNSWTDQWGEMGYMLVQRDIPEKEGRCGINKDCSFPIKNPDSFKAKDLFHVCKQYGHVIDSFIPLKRTKEGKRFGFVRFINVFNVERLVSNLCTIWVDRLKLHANRAMFDRAPLNRANAHLKNIAMPVKVTNHTSCMGDGAMGGGKSYVNVVASNARSGYSKDVGQNSYVGIIKKKIEFRQIMEEQHIPSLVLDDTCVLDYDYSLALVGKVSDFGLLNNIKTILIKEGFDNFVLKYLGESLEKFKSHVGVGSWFISLEYAHNSFNIDERVVWVDIEGVPMNVWTNNTFTKISAKWGELMVVEDKDNMSMNCKRLCIKSKMLQNIYENCKIIVKGKVFWIRVKEVSGWVLGFLEEDDEVDASEDDTSDNDYGGDMKAADFQEEAEVDDDVNEVPETIFDKTEASKEGNKTGGNDKEVTKSKEMLEFPPGFTPNMDSGKKGDQDGFLDAKVLISNKQENGRSIGLPTSGSILEVLDNLIKIGQTMGYKMDGGILCVWDSRMFRKDNATISDYFVAIQGDWISNAKKLLIIFVYAPQEISEKRMLWSYLNHMIDSLSGESIIMGDFNE
nr:peptidase C1A [Tanacetum cinerariifolium]